jgi:periplasmic protein TonB
MPVREATMAPVPRAAPAVWSAPSPSRHRGLGVALILSLFLHVAAMAEATRVRFGMDRPPILVELLPPVLGEGAPGQGPPPDAPPAPRPRPARVAAARPSAPKPSAVAAKIAETPPPPRAPVSEEKEEAVAPPPTPKTDWPAVQVPQYRGVGLAAANTPASSQTDDLMGPTVVQGSLARLDPGPHAAIAARAWGGAPGTSGNGGPLSPPQFQLKQPPRYPESARRAGIEGTTVVRAHILNDGSVGVAEVRRSSGRSDLDRAALDAIRASRFIPAERNGRAVTVWIEVPVQFNLTQ